MSTNENTEPSLLWILLPYLGAAVFVSVALVVALLKTTNIASVGPPTVVSFDVIKYTNAQRAVASAFLKPGADVSLTNELLLKLPERTRAAIAETAGAGALVVLKQAVVQGQTEDITDKVLTQLGLPTNVPTADGPAYSLDQAPTMFMVPPPKKIFGGEAAGGRTPSEQALP